MIDDYYLWRSSHEMTRLGKLVSPQTIRKRHQALKRPRRCSASATDLKQPSRVSVRAKGQTPGGSAFTLEEAVLVLSKADADPIVALPVRLALFTGMRLGEVLGSSAGMLALGEGGSRLIVADRSLNSVGDSLLSRTQRPRVRGARSRSMWGSLRR